MPLGWESNTKYMCQSAKFEGGGYLSFGGKSGDAPPSVQKTLAQNVLVQHQLVVFSISFYMLTVIIQLQW